MIKGEDSCVLQVLDSLKTYIIKNNDTSALRVLDIISGKSDGYLSEAIQDIVGEVFYENLGLLLWFCDTNKSNHLEKFLIYALSMEVSMEKEVARKRIDKFVRDNRQIKQLTTNQSKLLGKIVKRIDPTIWE
ncbi:hypothetical protein [Chitinophaga silvatica]|uniref:hypothetical protein n=1 Tax=Chitinophaga silvatica TaxID=2282649 RepID=UPI0011C1B310|nr:hypothetical protein [Chitinophaga silvatica]